MQTTNTPKDEIPNIPDRGIIYLVWGEQWKAELNLSVSSLQEFGYHYTVITKEEIIARFPEAAQYDHPGHFGLKTFMSLMSPYKTTLFLDTDTQILGDLSYGFEMAERHGIAMTIDHACYARRWASYNKQWPGWGPDFGPHDGVEYNTGVIFFSKEHPASKALFEVWNKIAGAHFSDQSTMAAAVYHSGINPFILPSHVWNYRPYTTDRLFGPVKIWHMRAPHKLNSEIRKNLIDEHGWKWYNIKAIREQNPWDWTDNIIQC